MARAGFLRRRQSPKPAEQDGIKGSVWCVLWRYAEDDPERPWRLGSIHRTEEGALRAMQDDGLHKVDQWGFLS